MSGASRWARIAGAELQLLLDALRTTPHTRAYLANMYGPGVSGTPRRRHRASLAARGCTQP